jgi:arginase
MPMDVEILTVPYDSGHHDSRMGRGPGHLLEAGLADLLRKQGHDVAASSVLVAEGFSAEIATTFALCGTLAEKVRRVVAAGRLPLMLSGNCFMALGFVSGLGASDTGIVWFDAHGEYNTPETTVSGFLDGMGLATATGNCWKSLAARIPGFQPIPEERIVHIGGRDLDSAERSSLARSRLTLVSAAEIASRGIRPALQPALDRLKAHVQRVYVHVDLDVLDPRELHANHFSTPGGMSAGAVEEAVALVRSHFDVAGVGIASYDPALDPDGRAIGAACGILSPLLR